MSDTHVKMSAETQGRGGGCGFLHTNVMGKNDKMDMLNSPEIDVWATRI